MRLNCFRKYVFIKKKNVEYIIYTLDLAFKMVDELGPKSDATTSKL